MDDDERLKEELFEEAVRTAQQPNPVTGVTPSAEEIASTLGVGVRRVWRCKSFYDSTYWQDQIEKARPRR